MRNFDLTPLYRASIGFDCMADVMDRALSADVASYPPYNIEHVAPDGFRITLAVAGFAEADLSITVEDRQLVIRGRQGETSGERIYLHRGIASRAFQRSFVLAEGIEVEAAALENGLLHIDLRRLRPDTIVKTIPISRQ